MRSINQKEEVERLPFSRYKISSRDAAQYPKGARRCTLKKVNKEKESKKN